MPRLYKQHGLCRTPAFSGVQNLGACKSADVTQLPAETLGTEHLASSLVHYSPCVCSQPLAGERERVPSRVTPGGGASTSSRLLSSGVIPAPLPFVLVSFHCNRSQLYGSCTLSPVSSDESSSAVTSDTAPLLSPFWFPLDLIFQSLAAKVTCYCRYSALKAAPGSSCKPFPSCPQHPDPMNISSLTPCLMGQDGGKVLILPTWEEPVPSLFHPSFPSAAAS